MARYALIEQSTGIVVNVVIWDGDTTQWAPEDGFFAILSDVAGPGWTYVNDQFAAPPPPELTEAEILAMQSSILQQLNQLAADQKAALTNRIGVIGDAIEFEEATPEEITELPIRQTQLTAWKRYAVLLGRVTTQEGWLLSVIWPEQPEEGMDLETSPVGRT